MLCPCHICLVAQKDEILLLVIIFHQYIDRQYKCKYLSFFPKRNAKQNDTCFMHKCLKQKVLYECMLHWVCLWRKCLWNAFIIFDQINLMTAFMQAYYNKSWTRSKLYNLPQIVKWWYYPILTFRLQYL